MIPAHKCFLATLFIITAIWKQPNVLHLSEWLNSGTREHNSIIIKNKTLMHTGR